MSVFKDKKKKQKKQKPIKTTLSFKHNNVLKEYEKKEETKKKLLDDLDHLNKKKASYCIKLNKDLTSAELENKLNTTEKIKIIECSLKILEETSNKEEYLLESSHLLFNYYESNQNIETSKEKTVMDFFKSHHKQTNLKKSPSKKTKIMNDFMKLTNKDFIPKTEIIEPEILDMCLQCQERRIVKPKRGVLICPKCGKVEKMLVNNNTPSYKEPPREITYFAYKKINHANEFLSQFQAKESTDIDNIIYEQILNELKKERYISVKNITAKKVREILKKLELTKYYEHCHYITNRISGKPPPVLTNALEEKLRNMFKQVQGPWLKYCPNERANFFSYPYIFFKFFQLLDEDEYLPYCRLLKSREKLHEHDEVWKKICEELQWQYIPTV